MEIFFIALSSIIVSAFGTIIGFGGGVFMIPILIIFFHVPINIAIGSVILALFPGSLISTIYNHRNNTIDYKSGIVLEIPTIFGTVAGSFLTVYLPTFLTEIFFSVFIGLVGLYMFNKARKGKVRQDENSIFNKLNNIGPRMIRTTRHGTYQMSYLLSIVFGLMAGVMAGFFGIGGGFLKTPIMVNVFNIPPFIAASTALFMIVITSFTGSISHYFLGHITAQYSIPVVIGFIIGAFAGNSLSVKVSEKMLGQLIGVGLLLAGFSVFIFSVFVKI